MDPAKTKFRKIELDMETSTDVHLFTSNGWSLYRRGILPRKKWVPIALSINRRYILRPIPRRAPFRTSVVQFPVGFIAGIATIEASDRLRRRPMSDN